MTTDAQPVPAVGTIHTLTPHDLAVTGGSVARLSGLAVFLDKGLPGETLRCRITESKPRFVKAEVLETLAPSPDETPSFCPFADRCGGCAWTTLSYPAELAWKERHVKETLRRIGKVDFVATEYLPITPSPRQTGYRNKMEFAFGLEDGQPALGLRQRDSHAVVSIGECALCALPVTNILTLTRQWMRDAALTPFDGKTGFCRFLVVRCPDYSPDGAPRCLVECITAPGNAKEAEAVAELGRLLMATAGVTGFCHSTRADRANVAYGERVVLSLGETTVTEKFGHLLLEAPAQAFLQANTGAATLLYEHIRTYAERTRTKTLWDIYCGVGGIALFLAREGLIVRGMETVAEAVRYAKKNAAALSGDNAFFRGDAGAKTTALSPAPDLIITDPPRAGMSAAVRDAILHHRPAAVIAVSCDAASLARDIAVLGAAYSVQSARAVDLFPHTPHVEVAALLTLSSR